MIRPALRFLEWLARVGRAGFVGRFGITNGRLIMSAQYAALGIQLLAAFLKWRAERRAAKAKAKAEAAEKPQTKSP